MGTKFSEWRVAHDLSLRELAALTGLSHQTLGDVDRGRRELHAFTKIRLARMLGVRVDQLFEPVEDLGRVEAEERQRHEQLLEERRQARRERLAAEQHQEAATG